MVRNRLENSVRYGARSEIVVRLSSDGDAALRLDVCDGGPGIPEPERERVFEPFYRIAGASEAAGGVGLGLSLVRQIARLHGGCCFRVTLPGA